MNWLEFHHPDWSLPVVKRRISEEWIDIMKDVGDMLISNGRSLLWNHSYPSQTAYRAAQSRLRKSGLLVQHSTGTNLPQLRLTPEALDRLPVYHDPVKQWNKKWNGIWYVLIFDVPEKERHYRDTFRGFLKRLHMGCLQKSVWVTPHDIRPEYDNLEQAANVQAVSYLLESRTVLHRKSSEIVQSAWNFTHLQTLHERYIDIFTRNMAFLKTTNCSPESVMNLLYNEAEAYIQCMRPDPLLPSELLPEGYQGKNVYTLHGQIRQAIAEALITSSSPDRGN